MKHKLLHSDKQKTYAIILDQGDDVTSCILAFAKDQNLNAAQLTAIGAFSSATLGFFDFNIKDYKKIEVPEQTEVLSLIGDISRYNGQPKLHAHVVLGKSDGTAHGGHLLKATANPTLEIILTESPAYLERKMNTAIHIPLIEI